MLINENFKTLGAFKFLAVYTLGSNLLSSSKSI